ncbi:hypothetical protein LXL04_003266 [Taraxacum kok-saghyz]
MSKIGSGGGRPAATADGRRWRWVQQPLRQQHSTKPNLSPLCGVNSPTSADPQSSQRKFSISHCFWSELTTDDLPPFPFRASKIPQRRCNRLFAGGKEKAAGCCCIPATASHSNPPEITRTSLVVLGSRSGFISKVGLYWFLSLLPSIYWFLRFPAVATTAGHRGLGGSGLW